MESIRINKHKLVETIKENRVKHEKEYREAVTEFRQACRALLERTLKLVKEPEAPIQVKKPLRALSVMLAAPESHLQDYDNVLLMLEMETRNEIDLDTNEFRQYVQDQWGWKRGFHLAKSSYSGTIFGQDRIGHTTVTSDSGLGGSRPFLPEDENDLTPDETIG